MAFLIPGHTKNVNDGAFGCVKMKMRRTNVHHSKDKVDLVKPTSNSIAGIAGGRVLWCKWKRYLGECFSVPASFKINADYIFNFRSSCEGIVLAKLKSKVTESDSFRLLRRHTKPGKFTDVALLNFPGICFRNTWPTLRSLLPKDHNNRAGYLKRHVRDRYFKYDEKFKM